MRSRSSALGALVLALIFWAVPVLPAAAAETTSSELVIIAESDVIRDDLYALANRVIIRGRVEGDLVAVAGQDVRIEGEVTGSVTVVAAELVVSGSIGGSLRATATSVTISGEVGRDALVASGQFSSESGSIIGGDIVVWAWGAEASGSVGGDLEGSQRNIDLAGEILGDIDISASKVSVTGDLHVGGDFGYRSSTGATGLDRADVDGVIVQKETTPFNIRLRALGLVARLLIAILLTAAALLVAWGWPLRTQGALDTLRQRPARSFAVGGLVMLSPALLIGLALLLFRLTPATAALPLIILLTPVIVATMGVVLVLSVVAGIPTVAWLGNLVARRATIYGAIAWGSAIVALIWLAPVVGWLVPVVFLSGGLGAWIGTFRPVDRPNVREPVSG
ncbi:MAG: hypothetical protein OEM32_06130 [Acidimicrobiia bacterium]|nr:hypothetical protein [Acidimicrobiia bacterium]